MCIAGEDIWHLDCDKVKAAAGLGTGREEGLEWEQVGEGLEWEQVGGGGAGIKTIQGYWPQLYMYM